MKLGKRVQVSLGKDLGDAGKSGDVGKARDARLQLSLGRFLATFTLTLFPKSRVGKINKLIMNAWYNSSLKRYMKKGKKNQYI